MGELFGKLKMVKSSQPVAVKVTLEFVERDFFFYRQQKKYL